jgi:hypothetical protein
MMRGANLWATPLRATATLAFLLFLHGPAAADPARMWIVGATVISPEGQDAGRVLNVLVEGDRIAAVADTLPGDAAQAATVMHAEGRFLIPGLIDSHVHLASIPGLMRNQRPEKSSDVRSAYHATILPPPILFRESPSYNSCRA